MNLLSSKAFLIVAILVVALIIAMVLDPFVIGQMVRLAIAVTLLAFIMKEWGQDLLNFIQQLVMPEGKGAIDAEQEPTVGPVPGTGQGDREDTA